MQRKKRKRLPTKGGRRPPSRRTSGRRCACIWWDAGIRRRWGQVTRRVMVGNAEIYHGVIMGTDEVREIAKATGVRRVVLTHNGGANNPEKRKPFIEAVGKVFSGDVLFPDELTTIDLLS